MPGVWVTHLGGHVALGETPEGNVVKELEEEANISLPLSEVIRMLSEESHVNFVALFDGDPATVRPQPGEVEKFEWLSLEEILRAEAAAPHLWNAGIHNFQMEYFHLRAALMGAHAAGSIQVPDELHVWRPVTV